MGLVVSFALITALGSAVLSTLGLPQKPPARRRTRLVVPLRVGLLVPNLESCSKGPSLACRVPVPERAAPPSLRPRPGSRLRALRRTSTGGDNDAGARHHASFYSVLLSFFFAAGAAVRC